MKKKFPPLSCTEYINIQSWFEKENEFSMMRLKCNERMIKSTTVLKHLLKHGIVWLVSHKLFRDVSRQKEKKNWLTDSNKIFITT